ncbi:hypothetical protein ARTSIC4J27_1010 [Pseudarthrobacter siccitolerans]|uniref:Uncharacterized protein n=1 Tax=Pseudarthrobacter siccitolerans TaxID=861266 RepID=A0A024GZN8_9MICC|nr:hypothetical protein ARTSIC4J27_1010 [Pseudarthrobacter siccitolerans]
MDGTSAQEFQATFDCPNPRWLAQVTDVDYSFEYSVTFEGFSEPAILITG